MKINLQRLATLLSSKDVSVYMGNNQTAYTDGKSIYLPHLVLDKERDFEKMRGYIDHEIGHVRFSRFGIPRNIVLNNLEASIAKMLEETYVEYRNSLSRPGTLINLRRLNEVLVEEGAFVTPKIAEVGLENVIVSYCLTFPLFKILRNKSLENTVRETRRQLVSTLDLQTVERVEKLLLKVKKNKSTNSNERLAKEIVKKLLLSSPKHPEGSEQSEGSEEAEGSEQSEGSEEAKGSEQSEGSEEAKGSEQSEGSEEAEGSEQSEGSDGSQDLKINPDKEIEVKNLSEILQQNINNLPESSNNKLGRMNKTPAYQTQVRIDKRRNGRLFDKSRNKIYIAPLASQLKMFLDAETRVKKSRKNTGRKLIQKRLHQHRYDPALFLSQKKGKSLDTAIHILLDISGSMDHKMKEAVDTMGIVSYALNTIPSVKFAVSAFPYHDQEQGVLIKDFQEPTQRIAEARLESNGSTPLSDAYISILPGLLNRPEKRKVIFIVSDGGPDDNVIAKDLIRSSSNMVESYLLGIGLHDAIYQHFIKGTFNGYCNIDDIKKLPQKIIEMMRYALVE